VFIDRAIGIPNSRIRNHSTTLYDTEPLEVKSVYRRRSWRAATQSVHVTGWAKSSKGDFVPTGLERSREPHKYLARTTKVFLGNLKSCIKLLLALQSSRVTVLALALLQKFSCRD
jgi:hypothetical protein